MLARVVGILTLLTAVFLAATPSATAQDEKPDFAAAKTHFKAGQAFVQMDKFGEAIVEFKKAHAITKDDLVMGQVAMTYEKAGDYEAALASIRVYRAALPAGERDSADALIKKYEQAIKDGKSTTLTLPSDKPAGGDETETTEGGETSTMEGEDSEDEGTGRKGRFYTWIAAGAAGALALSALIVGLNAQSKYDELSGTCSPACDPADVDSVKTRAVVTDILWGTAAAAAVAAGVLWFLEGRSINKDDEGRGPVEGEDEESDDDLVQRFRVAPIIGGGTYGIGGEIKF